ncbi:IS630 family transposase [Phormidesmis priestleyi]
MAAKKYKVALSAEERQRLEQLTTTGKTAAYKMNRARILLKADEHSAQRGWGDQAISAPLNVSVARIERVRHQFVEEGFEAVLSYKQGQQTRGQRLEGEKAAHLVALTCSDAPIGRVRWRLRLLAERMVELGHVEQISQETIRKTLKKNQLKPWLKECWVIAPEANAEFVALMEDVLEVYHRPYDPNYPVVCFDESNKQQVKETRMPIAMEPGQPERYDCKYERNGVSNLFRVFEPLAAQRQVAVTDQRTALDYPAQMQQLVEVHYPDALKIGVVQDQPNTHRVASLSKAFPPAEARRILDKLEFHFTPKHGSWLNMAEIELSVLARQCLARRICDQQHLKQEVAAWQQSRNAQNHTIDWQFTTADARIKLKRLYPSIQP